MNKIINIAVLAVFFQLTATAQGIDFQRGITLEQLKRKAKEENKYIFIDLYTTWCGPCKDMDANVYSNRDLGEYFNKNFISIKVQMDVTANDDNEVKARYADAKYLNDRFGIKSYPTLLLFSPKGELFSRIEGQRSSEDLLAEAKKLDDPFLRYSYYLSQLYLGNKDGDILKNVSRLGNSLIINQTRVAKNTASEFINQMKEDEIYTKDNVWFIYEFTSSVNDRGFKLFQLGDKQRIDSLSGHPGFTDNLLTRMINKDEINPFVSPTAVPDLIRIEDNLKKYGQWGETIYKKEKPILLSTMILKNEIEPYLMIRQKPNWQELSKKIWNKYGQAGEKVLLESKAAFYLNANSKKAIPILKEYISKYVNYISTDDLNNYSWFVFKNSSVKSDLISAIVWIEKALARETKNELLDTHANLLYKVGRKTEAIVIESKLVNLDSNSEEFKQTLLKMNSNLATW